MEEGTTRLTLLIDPKKISEWTGNRKLLVNKPRYSGDANQEQDDRERLMGVLVAYRY